MTKATSTKVRVMIRSIGSSSLAFCWALTQPFEFKIGSAARFRVAVEEDHAAVGDIVGGLFPRIF